MVNMSEDDLSPGEWELLHDLDDLLARLSLADVDVIRRVLAGMEQPEFAKAALETVNTSHDDVQRVAKRFYAVENWTLFEHVLTEFSEFHHITSDSSIGIRIRKALQRYGVLETEELFINFLEKVLQSNDERDLKRKIGKLPGNLGGKSFVILQGSLEEEIAIMNGVKLRRDSKTDEEEAD